MIGQATEFATNQGIRSQAIGMLAGTGFGAAWAVMGLSGHHGGYASFLALLALAILAGLLLATFDLFRLARRAGLPQAVDGGRRRRNRRAFLAILAIEVIAMNLAAWALYPAHMGYLTSAIALIVGLHFLPLAALWQRPHLRIAAIAMSLAALASIAALALGAGAPTINTLLEAACALALWVTCFASWRSIRRRLAARTVAA